MFHLCEIYWTMAKFIINNIRNGKASNSFRFRNISEERLTNWNSIVPGELFSFFIPAQQPGPVFLLAATARITQTASTAKVLAIALTVSQS